MSGIAMDELRTAVMLACLCGLAGGCKSVPGLPAHAPDNLQTASTDDSDDGWLVDRLLGRQAASPTPASPATSSPSAPSSDVRQASAEEPVYPPQGSVGPTGENIEDALKEVEKEPEKSKESEKPGFALSDLAPGKVFQEAKTLAGYGPDEQLARRLFEEGQDLYRQKDYEKAAEKFKSAASRWPDSPLEEDALFYRGESLFFANRYVDANDVFSALIKKYENSRYLDRIVRRLFNIARYWEQLQKAKPLWVVVPNLTDKTRPLFDTSGHAMQVYERIHLNDPTGPLADDSIMATANAFFLNKRYEDAAYYYDMLRKEYPKSEHQLDAHRLGMKAKLLAYQGPFYDGTALDEAAEIADQTLRQFHGELRDEREEVLRQKNLIVEKQAEREWTLGHYYDRKGYYGAARFYYNGLATNTRFARTKFAEMARKRLEEIKDRPAKPPNRFKWLTDLVPSGR